MASKVFIIFAVLLAATFLLTLEARDLSESQEKAAIEDQKYGNYGGGYHNGGGYHDGGGYHRGGGGGGGHCRYGCCGHGHYGCSCCVTPDQKPDAGYVPTEIKN